MLSTVVSFELIPTKKPASFWQSSDYWILGAIIFSFFTALVVWRKATFTKKDFIRVAKKEGIQINRKEFYYSLIELFGEHSYADGFLGEIYAVARLDIPFITFWPTLRVRPRKSKEGLYLPPDASPGTTLEPKYMTQESEVELFSLISGPFNVNTEIKILDEIGEIPSTGCLEIDTILKSTLLGTSHFHAKLSFNSQWLRMIIIGGSWEGLRFENKIENGIAIFRQLDSALRNRYPTAVWNNCQVKWNLKDEQFYLEQKETNPSK
jgi:hypothetical protein